MMFTAENRVELSNKTALIPVNTKTIGAIHSTKIPTAPTGKSGPPQKVNQFFGNFSGWTEPTHWVLDRNFRKFRLNESRPKISNVVRSEGLSKIQMPGSLNE